MPRGRAGLSMISRDEVRRVLHSPSRRGRARNVAAAARFFKVTERTVRRYIERGLTLFYGKKWISRKAWAQFAAETCPTSISDKSRSSPVRAPARGQV